jgi:hypothetical protein
MVMGAAVSCWWKSDPKINADTIAPFSLSSPRRGTTESPFGGSLLSIYYFYTPLPLPSLQNYF